VPASAIVFDDQGLHVLVVRRGVAHLRKITKMRELGTEVEVDDGVNAGDEVVLNPSVDLGDRSKVEIRASDGANAPS
jgi:hypothetical protein